MSPQTQISSDGQVRQAPLRCRPWAKMSAPGHLADSCHVRAESEIRRITDRALCEINEYAPHVKPQVKAFLPDGKISDLVHDLAGRGKFTALPLPESTPLSPVFDLHFWRFKPPMPDGQSVDCLSGSKVNSDIFAGNCYPDRCSMARVDGCTAMHQARQPERAQAA